MHANSTLETKRGELSAGTSGQMTIRTVISRAMTRCEDGMKRSIMLADVKTAFLDDTLSASGRYLGHDDSMI